MADTGSEKDYKTQLQEKFHAQKLPSPTYDVVGKGGSEHLPIWTVKVALNEQLFALGEGQNKKAAEQQAAAKLLEMLE